MHDDDNLRYVTNKGYIKLTPMENRILKILILNKNHVVGYDKFGISKEHLRNTIKTLRNKLAGELNIITRNSIGYFCKKNNKMH